MKNINELLRFPLDIQFYAEEGDGESGNPDVASTGEEEVVPKKIYDKMSAELSKLKKEMRQNMSQEEQRRIEMEEKDSKIADLQKQLTLSSMITGLNSTGFDEATVKAISEAYVGSNPDGFVKAISKAVKELNDNHKREIENLKLESTPRPAGGTGDGNDKPITQKEFNNMSYMEQLEFKNKNPETYKKFIKK